MGQTKRSRIDVVSLKSVFVDKFDIVAKTYVFLYGKTRRTKMTRSDLGTFWSILVHIGVVTVTEENW